MKTIRRKRSQGNILTCKKTMTYDVFATSTSAKESNYPEVKAASKKERQSIFLKLKLMKKWMIMVRMPLMEDGLFQEKSIKMV